MTGERKKKVKRGFAIFGLVLAGIFGVMLLAAACLAIRAGVHMQSPEVFGSYRFDGGNTPFSLDLFPSLVLDEDAEEIKILQIADPQLKFCNFPSRDRKTMDLLERAIEAEKPDLCVVTGDLTLSVFTWDAFRNFARFMEKKKQYWTFVFGNHDAQFDCSKYTLCKLLEGYEYCLFDAGPEDIHGTGNFLVNIYRGEKRAEDLVYSLVCLDSGMYPEANNVSLTDWVYDWIRTDQMDWYDWAVAGLKEEKPDIQSTMFFHIPIKEFANLYYLNELEKGREIPETVKEQLPDVEIRDVTGVVRESEKAESEYVYGDEGYTVGVFYQGNAEGTDHPDVFARIKAGGCTKALFCGHDHVNNLKGYYDGIYLGYGLCCGYHTYPFFNDPPFFKDKVLFNGALWTDEEGNRMEKGVTAIGISLKEDYGAVTAVDRPDSYYR